MKEGYAAPKPARRAPPSATPSGPTATASRRPMQGVVGASTHPDTNARTPRRPTGKSRMNHRHPQAKGRRLNHASRDLLSMLKRLIDAEDDAALASMWALIVALLVENKARCGLAHWSDQEVARQCCGGLPRPDAPL